MNEKTNHSRFPVVGENFKLEGIVTSKEVINQERHRPIERVMTKHPITVSKTTSVANASHIMIWKGIELLPVVDDQNRLLGIISRQDVLKALQMHQRQPHVGETIDNIIFNNLQELPDEKEINKGYRFEITPQMTNFQGTLSYGVLTSIIIESVSRFTRSVQKADIVVESLKLFYYLKPMQIDNKIQIFPRILELGRKYGKSGHRCLHQRYDCWQSDVNVPVY